MSTHRGPSGDDKSLEEAVLLNIDQAAASVRAPVDRQLLIFKRLLVAAALFIAIFAGTTAYALMKINEVAKKPEQYLVDSCQSSNVRQANELSFWLDIFAASENDPRQQTKRDIELRKVYLAKLYKTYPQVDCSKVKLGKRVEIPPKK